MAAKKWASLGVTVVDGMGEAHPEGSYRRLVFETANPWPHERVEVVVSEGAAEQLRDELAAAAREAELG